MTSLLDSDLQLVAMLVCRRIVREFENFGGRIPNLEMRTFSIAKSEEAYLALQDMAARPMK